MIPRFPMCSGSLGGPPGALGDLYLQTNEEVGGNPKAVFDANAWDFDTCTYWLNTGDTLDGLAQLYMGCKAGAWVPHGTTCINLINQANTDNALINAGRQNELLAGTPIHMPQLACDNARAMWKVQCAAGAKTVWDDNHCATCIQNSTPGDGSTNRPERNQCYCDVGYVYNRATEKCEVAPPPAPGCTGGKIKDANGNCVCPPGMESDGGTGCKPVPAPPPKDKPKTTGVNKAGMGAGGWWLIAAAVLAVGYTVNDQMNDKKKKPAHR